MPFIKMEVCKKEQVLEEVIRSSIYFGELELIVEISRSQSGRKVLAGNIYIYKSPF